MEKLLSTSAWYRPKGIPDIVVQIQHLLSVEIQIVHQPPMYPNERRYFLRVLHGALRHPETDEQFVVPTLVGLFKNPPKGGTTNGFS
jgi:hypothetical protein